MSGVFCPKQELADNARRKNNANIIKLSVGWFQMILNGMLSIINTITSKSMGHKLRGLHVYPGQQCKKQYNKNSVLDYPVSMIILLQSTTH